MIEKGIFLLPMNLKRNHITASHTKQDVQHTLENAEKSLTEIANERS
jgi:glutamate-1-semialdehyde 2,1-aminomutase